MGYYPSKSERAGRVAAESFRRDHGLGQQPLGDLVSLIDQTLGYDVAVVDIGAHPDQHGMSMRDPLTGAVFIGVAATPHPMRQRSTLAHEMCHVLHDDWGINYDGDLSARPFEEKRADAFARHLLIPQQGITDYLDITRRRGTTMLTPVELSAIVQHFLVSPAVASIALCEHGSIDEATKEDWMRLTTPQLATRFGWSDRYGALSAESRAPRVPQRLLARAIAGYEAGVVTVRTVATLRSVPVEQVEAEFGESGIARRESPAGSFRATEDDILANSEDIDRAIAELSDE
ncbi:ImmA/IrrE family metallo-endopeptidase [Corynebacterium sp.]|uniref:ImmA/IrrE family metallo-endopeptidase n=1 Tax=Corynebacterium sp. TaxID=1720 RepID=UPI0026DF97A6|nr:ImmA/IrrE family metallo-endopeptidase [Corynebacterium sp.]MDO5511642.1 ImmA/IrrE family metallo-endopeptidase [Corynebacterium sp.]